MQMLSTIYCMSRQHNPWLVMLAALVCTFGSATSLRLMLNARQAPKSVRLGLLIMSGVCGGAAVWATHFIAMLAFDPGMMTAYDPAGTIASLAIALVGGAASVILAVKTPNPWRYGVWGALHSA
jgi:NO-binding membrane sensor protein with MHYT domain